MFDLASHAQSVKSGGSHILTRTSVFKIGGGGTYVNVAARMWLNPSQLGMIVDRGNDWRQDIQDQLDSYGPCWVFRDDDSRQTTRVCNFLVSSV